MREEISSFCLCSKRGQVIADKPFIQHKTKHASHIAAFIHYYYYSLTLKALNIWPESIFHESVDIFITITSLHYPLDSRHDLF